MNGSMKPMTDVDAVRRHGAARASAARFAVLVFLAPLFVSLSAAAQTPYLVKDINTTSTLQPKSSSPAWFTSLGNKVLFAATTAAAGTELWSTDGTAAGTSMV